MINNVKLEHYLPDYIQEYREMLKLMQAENPEFQIAFDETDKIRNNLFIETCDEKGISRFEKMMGIFPSDNEPLAARISRVLTRWNDKLPYTYFYLLSKLNALCGTNNYEIEKRFNQYEMDITTHLELLGQVDELDYLLKNVVPVNILLNVNNTVRIESKGDSNVAAGLVFCTSFELSDNFKEDFIVNTGDSFAGALLSTIEIGLTDNFNENINIESDQNIGSILSVCENLIIRKE